MLLQARRHRRSRSARLASRWTWSARAASLPTCASRSSPKQPRFEARAGLPARHPTRDRSCPQLHRGRPGDLPGRSDAPRRGGPAQHCPRGADCGPPKQKQNVSQICPELLCVSASPTPYLIRVQPPKTVIEEAFGVPWSQPRDTRTWRWTPCHARGACAIYVRARRRQRGSTGTPLQLLVSGRSMNDTRLRAGNHAKAAARPTGLDGTKRIRESCPFWMVCAPFRRALALSRGRRKITTESIALGAA